MTSIDAEAFAVNPNLHLVTVEATTPPTLGTNVFFNNTNNIVNLVVPEGTKEAYEAAGWTGFKSITEPPEINGTFTDNHITYRITSLVPFKVTAIDYNTAGGTVVDIPETVDHGDQHWS